MVVIAINSKFYEKLFGILWYGDFIWFIGLDSLYLFSSRPTIKQRLENVLIKFCRAYLSQKTYEH